jgi:hypothetical protein
MTHEGLTHLPNAGIRGTLHTGEDRLGDRGFIEVAHSCPSLTV